MWCRTRDHLFRTHPQSPIPAGERDSFRGLSYFAYDPAMRIMASVEQVDAEPWIAETGEGVLTLDRFARARFTLAGRPQSLDLYWIRAYGGGMLLSFRDAGSGTLTYGGCRYLLDTVKGADLGCKAGRLILDFNFAYQPSCSYDPRWVCPLAPVQNRLGEVNAGERLPSRP